MMRRSMNQKTRVVAALTCGLLVIGCTTAVAAGTGTPVQCDITDNTLTCPLPPPPVPVTETVTNTETATVTETQQNTVTETTTATTTVTVPAGPENLFGDAVPVSPSDPDDLKVELGVRFKPTANGVVTGVRFYKGPGNTGTHTGSLWSAMTTTKLATVTFTGETDSGWQQALFAKPVFVSAGTEYIGSYLAPVGKYAADGAYPWPKVSGNLTGLGSLYKYGGGKPADTFNASNYYVDVLFIPTGQPIPPTTTPVPTTPTTAPTTTAPPVTTAPTTATTAPTTTTPPTPGGIVVLGRSFPNEDTTGVPAGTQLTPYAGPMTITTAGVVIDGKTVNGELRIFAKNVVIRNSVINGNVYVDYNAGEGSFTITDSEVRQGDGAGTGIGDAFFTATRVEVTGGTRSINCYAQCTVTDSYVHGQWNDTSGRNHESGIRVNTNSHLVHNTIGCTADDFPPDAGCSAAITGYPDFDPVQGNVIENNLILAGSGGYCAYGGSTAGKPYSGQTKNITFRDNIWQRGTEMGDGGRGYVCGFWGPITSFDSSAPGNVWTNNLYDDGAPVPPAN